jgi:hypothetical protein
MASSYDQHIGGDLMVDWMDRIEARDEDIVVLPEPLAATNDSDLIDEFIEFFNARDLDGLAGMLAGDVEAELVHAAGTDGVLNGLEGLFIREPLMLLTRGDADGDGLAVVWHPGESGYQQVGFLAFEFTDEDDDEALLTRIEYFDEINADDLVVEEPDEIEAEEWEVEEG